MFIKSKFIHNIIAIFDTKLFRRSSKNKDNKEIIILTEITMTINAAIIPINKQVRFDESSKSTLTTLDKVTLISEIFLIL
jgi:hypothetical protein